MQEAPDAILDAVVGLLEPYEGNVSRPVVAMMIKWSNLIVTDSGNGNGQNGSATTPTPKKTRGPAKAKTNGKYKPRFIGAIEAAALLNMPVSSFYRLVSLGKVTGKKVGSTPLRFNRKEIKELAHQRA